MRGQRAPVVGRVSMNNTMVDVTDIPGVAEGDEVVLFGRQGDAQITQKEVEDITGTILADQYTVWGQVESGMEHVDALPNGLRIGRVPADQLDEFRCRREPPHLGGERLDLIYRHLRLLVVWDCQA